MKKEWFKKEKYVVPKMIISFFFSLCFSMILELIIGRNYYGFLSFNRVFILTLLCYFIIMHFIAKLKTLYNYIYKKRFLITFIAFILCVLLGYSGSSISMYNQYVYSEEELTIPIFGEVRGIRSDEWAVNTPISFSQNMQKNEKLPYINNSVRGTNTDMYTVVNAPVLDILLLAKPFNIGYLLGNTTGLSFWWCGRFFALLIISFEFCMVLTNKNKIISALGMILITFSPATQWWYSNFLPDLLIWGQLAIVLINAFMTSKKQTNKVFIVIGFIITAISYIFIFYPAWEVSFGYVFLALAFWVIWKNRKIYKINKKDVLIIIIAIILIALFGVRYYCLSQDTLNAILHTSYPGEKVEAGGGGEYNLFSYVYNIFAPYKANINSPENMGMMISYYPIPLILSIIYMLRNKKGKSFVLPMIVVSVLFSIWAFTRPGDLYGKLTLFYLISPRRITVPLSLTQSYLMIYLLGNIKKEDKLINKNIVLCISLIFTVILFNISFKYAPDGYVGPFIESVSILLLFSVIYLLFQINNNENKKQLIILLTFISIVGGITVNPLIKGTDVLSEKPLAQSIQSIVKENDNAIWITDNFNFPVSNYVLANGAKIINSTNYYPNEEMISNLFENKEEIKEIYNRYAHIFINLIVDNKTSVELMLPDAYKLNLNIIDLEKLNIQYILSSRNLEQWNTEQIKFLKMSDDFGYCIYKVVYE